MANSRRVKIRYTPRMSEYEAYEKLPPTLKRALQEAVSEWSSYWALTSFEQNGLARTIDLLHAADVNFMLKKVPAPPTATKKKRPQFLGSFAAVNVKPLKAYGITRNTRLNMGQK